MTKSDWSDWLAHPVTKLFFLSVQNRREDLKEVLILQAGNDPVQDSQIKGYAQALVDISNTDFEEVDNDA